MSLQLNQLVTSQKKSLPHFVLDVFPWRNSPDAEVISFTSVLSDAMFDGGDYKALRDVHCIKGALGETVTLAQLPYRFIERELFQLDVSDEAQVLDFVKSWGFPYCPFYNSKQLLFNGGEGLDMTPVASLGGKIGLKKLGDLVLDGWDEIERWHSRLGLLSDGDGFARSFREGVRESEGVRRELYATGKLKEGEYAISFSEASQTLKFLQETCAVALALDVAGGNAVEAEQIVLEFGVVPHCLFEALYRGATADSILSESEDTRQEFKEQFVSALFRGRLRDLRAFLNSYVSGNDGVCLTAFKLYGDGVFDGGHSGVSRDGVGGVGEAIVCQLAAICGLSVPWKRCSACGKPFKRYEKSGDCEGNFKRAKKSEYCTAGCQQAKKRRDRREAKEFARQRMRNNADNLFRNSDQICVNNILLDITHAANERYPSKRKDCPTITKEMVERVFREEKMYYESHR